MDDIGWFVALALFILWMVSMYRVGKAIEDLKSKVLKLMKKHNIKIEEIDRL